MSKFWEVDDILMTSEIVPCMAEEDIKGLNFHDKLNGVGDFSEDNNINITKEGNKLEVPLWFALILKETGYVSMIHPKYLTDKFYNLLQTDPTIVNFKVKNVFIYDICMKLIPVLENKNNNEEEERNWPRTLSDTIHKRFLYFLKNASNVVYENYSLMKIVCHREKTFYDKMVKINKNVRFYIENYENNNKNLDEVVQAKLVGKKSKKLNK